MKIKHRHCGTSLVEILIAVLVFLFGLLVLSLSLMYALDTVTGSRGALKSDQLLANAAEEYLTRRIIDNKTKPTDVKINADNAEIKPLSSSGTFSLYGKNVKYSLYRLQMKEKSSPFYLMEKR